MREAAKILIVDDEADIVKAVVFRLKKAGYKAIAAETGEEGLARASEEKPDLIILDYRLPGMDGIEVFRRLRDDGSLKEIPVIFLTASSGSDETKKLLKEAGARDVLVKPYDPEELLARVRQLIG